MLRPRAPWLLLSLALTACSASGTEPAPGGGRDRARRSGAATEAPCDSSYGVLCGAEGEADDARAARLAVVQRSVEDATLGALSARVGFAPATRDAWTRHLEGLDPGAQEALRRLFRKTRAAEVEQRVAPLRAAVEEELARVVAIARERVAAREEVPDREAVLARLDATRLSWVDLADPSPAHARALRRGCGTSLLVDDAWIDKTATAITACPGFLLVSTEPDEPETGGPGFRQRIAFLLAHEVGHVIVGRAEPTLEDERAAEIEADRWAAEIVAAEIAAIADPAARESFLRRTLEPICSPHADPVHPSGPDRVGLVASHPIVAGALGCGA